MFFIFFIQHVNITDKNEHLILHYGTYRKYYSGRC